MAVSRYKKIKEELESIANSKINSLGTSTLRKLEKKHLKVIPRDIIHIMTLLACSKTDESLALRDISNFFDQHGNLLGGTFNPFAYLYHWLEEVEKWEHYESGESLNKKYLKQKIDGFDLYDFQFEILVTMLEIMGEDQIDSFPPARASARKRILKIAELIYPSEFKKILQATTEFLDDINGPHIDANNENGILTIKLNHKLDVYRWDYNRRTSIFDFIYGGLLLEGFGKFTHKTPRRLHKFFEHNPNLFNFYRPARITTSMRWDDRRTLERTKKHGKSFRESRDEYIYRHEQLAYAWNDGLFGPFNFKCHNNFTIFKWKYPDFFKLDSIEDIQNDHTWIFRFLLDSYEGTRYPDPPYDLILMSNGSDKREQRLLRIRP